MGIRDGLLDGNAAEARNRADAVDALVPVADDPKVMGAPTGWTLHITDVVLSAGAGFLVVISGSMMLMPGLPKVSRAMGIDVDAAGEITGMS